MSSSSLHILYFKNKKSRFYVSKLQEEYAKINMHCLLKYKELTYSLLYGFLVSQHSVFSCTLESHWELKNNQYPDPS